MPNSIALYGSCLVAGVNLIALGFTIHKVYWKQDKRLDALAALKDQSQDNTVVIEQALMALKQELGISTEVEAKGVIAKKYELAELRSQVETLKAGNLSTLNGLFAAQQAAATEVNEYQRQKDILENKPLIKFANGHRTPRFASFQLKLINYGEQCAITGISSDADNIKTSTEIGKVVDKGDTFSTYWDFKDGTDIRGSYNIVISMTDRLDNTYQYKIAWKNTWDESDKSFGLLEE
jgi:hypothetical protein